MDNGKQVFVFGEIHGAQGNYEYMKNTLTALSGRGVKNFAIELPEDAQEAFSNAVEESRYAGHNREGVIHAQNGAKLSGFGDYAGLASHARSLGMNVHCVDAPRDPKGREVEKIARMDRKINQGQITGEKYVQEVQSQFSRRNDHMADRVASLEGDTVLVTGMFHTGGVGSVEEKLRDRGLSVVSVDLYPNGHNPTVDLFERHENPPVDLKIKNMSEGPTPSDIGSMISRLRGNAKNEEPVEVGGVKPLRKGLSMPSFEPANIRRAVAVER